MPTDFPLWRLRPEEAARIIVLESQHAVEKHKFWRKREMRLRPSKRSAPRQDDIKTLDKANNHLNWYYHFQDWAEEFPIIGVLIGPLRKDGLFYAPERPTNALSGERPREPWQGMYSREQYEADFEYLEQARALLRENFILGQRKEGPYLDGIVFMRADSLLEAEQLRCKNRLQMTWAMIEASRKTKRGFNPQKPEYWKNIGNDEAVAMSFKQSGYEIRKIDRVVGRHYEVKL